MTIKKVTSEVRLAGEYVDKQERQAIIDRYGALKTVTLNYKPGRSMLMKGFKLKARPAFDETTPRTTDYVWELPYGIDLTGGVFKAIKANDGDILNITLLIPTPDGNTQEIAIVEDLYLYQGEEYSINSDASMGAEKGWAIKISYTNTAVKEKDIFFSFTFFR